MQNKASTLRSRFNPKTHLIPISYRL